MREEKREQEDDINDLSMVLQSREQVYTKHKSQHAEQKHRQMNSSVLSGISSQTVILS